MPERQKGNGRFFVARGQAPTLLETAKKAFDFVAVAVGFRVHRGWFEAIGTAGDNGFNAILSAIGAVFVAVVGRVGQHFARLQALEQGQGLRAVAGVPAGGNQAHGVAQGLGAGMDLGAHPVPAAAQALGFGAAFFWPAEC